MRRDALKVGVVGHIEWVQFARVEHVPRAGEVVHASEPFEEPAGGGGVAAVQLARLARHSSLVTALGGDEQGERSRARLVQLGVEVHASVCEEPTRRAVTLLDADGERTITTLGARLEPRASLVRERLAAAGGLDGVYVTAGDVECLRAARAGARVLVASPRAVHALGQGVEIDALVLSAQDERELAGAAGAAREARVLVITEGERGGRYQERSGARGRWRAAALQRPARDSYGCGDSFAAGLTFALAAGMELAAALGLAARCGAECATGRGPYERQLGAQDL